MRIWVLVIEVSSLFFLGVEKEHQHEHSHSHTCLLLNTPEDVVDMHYDLYILLYFLVNIHTFEGLKTLLLGGRKNF